MIAIDAPAIVRLMDCATTWPRGADLSKAAAPYIEPLKEAIQRAEITTPLRLAHFFAHGGHECGGLRWMEEFATGEAYDIASNPSLARSLGNLTPGDGKRYKGRGVVQCTGRDNYLAYGIWMGVGDLFVREPKLVSTDPRNAVLTLPWFWITRKLNTLADGDTGGLTEVLVKGKKIAANSTLVRETRIINGGTNGIEDRQRRLAANKKFLGIK